MRLHLAFLSLVTLLSGCATFSRPSRGETIHRNVVYAVRPGKKLHLDLYVPARPRPAPVIVWLHGGGWKYGDKGYHFSIRDLTREGFAVASVQYRLLWHSPWPAQIDDSMETVRWVRENGARYGIDPKRLAVAGESAGGSSGSPGGYS